MTHRIFTDDHGRAWEVWEVFPEVVERRLNEERRTVPRATPDRRQHVDIRFRMAPELRDGWLAFQSNDERKRLAPIPSGWSSLDDAALGELASRATRQPVLVPDRVERPDRRERPTSRDADSRHGDGPLPGRR